MNGIIFFYPHVIYFGYLIADSFKVKEKKGKRKNVVKEKDDVEKEKDEETIDFEECTNFETDATFYQMNLSRPLLKVCVYNIITK